MVDLKIFGEHHYYHSLQPGTNIPTSAATCSGKNYLGFGTLCLGVQNYLFLPTTTAACAKRTGAAACVERRRREPDRVISPE